MSKIYGLGFAAFFVPEASAAVETQETWATGAIHKATTVIISQSLGSLISYKDILRAMNE